MSAVTEVRTSPQDAMKALESLAIAHPTAKEAFETGKKLLAPGPGRRIVLFSGPPGFGKSWLASKLHDACVAACGELVSKYPNAQPSRRIEASEAGGGGFSWEEVYDEIIGDQLVRPRNGSKLALPWEPIAVDSQRQGNRVSRKKAAAVKKLKFDHTRQLLMDEVAHLLGDGSPKAIATSARALKSFSNKAVTKVALFSCYDGLDLMTMDTQLARRIQLVELRPYDSECSEDMRVFKSVVLTIGKALGLDEGELLVRSEQLMERTNGAVGALVDTFFSALTMGESGKPFNYKLLDRYMPSKDWAKRVHMEIIEGRKRMEDLL